MRRTKIDSPNNALCQGTYSKFNKDRVFRYNPKSPNFNMRS